MKFCLSLKICCVIALGYALVQACSPMDHESHLPDPELQWYEGLVSPSAAKEEMEVKLGRMRSFLEKEGKEMVIFGTERNVKWLTGAHFNGQIVLNKEGSSVYLGVHRSGELFLISNNIEVRRALDEGLQALGFKPLIYEWYLPGMLEPILQEKFGNLFSIYTDTDLPFLSPLPESFRSLRFSFTEQERLRYRALAEQVTAAVEEVCLRMQPGITERELEALTAMALWKRGIMPTVLLMAADERITDYRHALPGEKAVSSMAMVNVVAEKWNMPVAITRFVHFGPVAEETLAKFEAVAKVNAQFQQATRPGIKVRGIFGSMQNWYEKVGYRWEWEKHHQGGAIGYDDREYIIRPGVDYVIQAHQPFAWNPSITGSKMEETIITTEDGFEVLTKTGFAWPMYEVELDGKIYPQPWILIRD